MRHTFFVSDTSQSADIDIGERQYVRGEAGSAETCDSFCSTCGRGHVHVLPCDPYNCNIGGQGRRHATVTYSSDQPGDALVAKDELTHDAYWEAIGFNDPCSDLQRREFRMCGAACASTAHEEDERNGKLASCYSGRV